MSNEEDRMNYKVGSLFTYGMQITKIRLPDQIKMLTDSNSQVRIEGGEEASLLQ